LKCARCGCKIEIPEAIKGQDWQHVKSWMHLKVPRISNPCLVLAVNNGFKENVWLCNNCFKVWAEFESGEQSWKEAWKIFQPELKFAHEQSLVRVQFS
jgi:hypothetical protein